MITVPAPTIRPDITASFAQYTECSHITQILRLVGKPHVTQNSHHSKLLQSSQLNQVLILMLQNEKNHSSGHHFNGSHVTGL